MDPLFLIRYNEIALKGHNRPFFEKLLIKNIKGKCRNEKIKTQIERKRGRIYLHGPIDPTSDIVKAIPGVDSFSLTFFVEKSPHFITRHKDTLQALLKQSPINLDDFTFKIECRREDKYFPMNSYEICRELGAFISKSFPGSKVKMQNPDFTLNIEVRHKIFFIANKITCLGGLPVGSTGKGLLLLSGGIDSPVAGIKMAIRGISLSAIHFHSYPYTSKEAQDKIKDIILILKKYTPNLKLYFYNLSAIQKLIQNFVEPKYFTIIMRRAMLMIAEKLCLKNEIKCLITGESMGQVASQTLESLTCTNESVQTTIFRPLIGLNKSEIINLSKQYNTYDISIRPYEDCCTIFNPPSPVTRPNINLVKSVEQKIVGFKEFIEDTLNNIEIIKI